MSVRELLEGECGRENALVRLGNQITRDTAFKDEGLGGPHASVSHFWQRPGIIDESHLVNEFLSEYEAPPQTFNMNELISEIRQVESIPTFAAATQPPPLDTWSAEYMLQNPSSLHQDPALQAVWNDMREESRKVQTYQKPWVDDFLVRKLDADNSKITEIDDSQAARDSANALLNSVDNKEYFSESEFMRFMDRVGSGRAVISNQQVIDSGPTNWAAEFAKQKQNESRLENIGDWAKEFEETQPHTDAMAEEYNTQYWNKLQEEWKNISETDTEHPWISEFTDYFEPYKEYNFVENNPMKDLANALELGKRYLEQGLVPNAVLCFEAAVIHEPDNADAWLLLGRTQAENEQDPQAIAALRKCLTLTPNNLNALMALAVSYTNESYQAQACNSLVSWMKHHPAYEDMVPPNMQTDNWASSFMNSDQQADVQNLFLRAVQRTPDKIDPDVQGALGVLFNLSQEYDKAAECFNIALQVKPDDFRLWNRLGATLANGNRSEEAVDAYHRALELQPGFIRARYNVGITCINLKAYREAAEHFLTALNLQAKTSEDHEIKSSLNTAGSNGNSQMSDTIWSTLRMVCSLMDRQDLRPVVESRDLIALNKAFNIE